MPTYEYACAACDTRHEVVQKMSDASLTVCPSCGDPSLRKLFTNVGVHFKGSGFYRTDSRDAKSSSSSGSSGSSSSGSDSGSSSGSSSSGADSGSSTSGSSKTGSSGSDSGSSSSGSSSSGSSGSPKPAATPA